MASFACKDIGIQCGWTANAPTEKELMPKIADHAARAHKITKMDSALESQIKAAIKR